MLPGMTRKDRRALAALRTIAGFVAGLVVLTAGFFAAHSVASGWVGGRAPVAPAQASALYLCLYYIGSSVAGSAGGIFYAHGDAWLHYTGEGTAASPVDLYDAGHEPMVAWRPAGAR